MTTLKELCTYLNDLLQADLFQDYCPNGLQVEGKKSVSKGVFAVSASLAVIQKAAEMKADFIFVHHGIFWNRDAYPLVGTKKEKIKTLLANDISLIAYHLPLDQHELYGNNWKAAADLGWTNCRPFEKIGVKGEFDPISRDAFQKKIEEYYGHKAHTVTGGKDQVSSAALISGGAHQKITQAALAEVDCYITGSFDEPVWHQSFEEAINFFAVGHAASERIGPLAIMEHLKNKFGLETVFIDESNPF